MDNRDTKAILEYHEATKHSEASIRSGRHTLDWGNQPLPFKIYRGLEPIQLVKDFPARDVPALSAIFLSSLASRSLKPGFINCLKKQYYLWRYLPLLHFTY